MALRAFRVGTDQKVYPLSHDHRHLVGTVATAVGPDCTQAGWRCNPNGNMPDGFPDPDLATKVASLEADLAWAESHGQVYWMDRLRSSLAALTSPVEEGGTV